MRMQTEAVGKAGYETSEEKDKAGSCAHTAASSRHPHIQCAPLHARVGQMYRLDLGIHEFLLIVAALSGQIRAFMLITHLYSLLELQQAGRAHAYQPACRCGESERLTRRLHLWTVSPFFNDLTKGSMSEILHGRSPVKHCALLRWSHSKAVSCLGEI